MRIYSNCYELMSETGRNIWEMGAIVKPKSYQNKNIEGNDDFVTKELICEQYCLTDMPDEKYLFAFDPASKKWAELEIKERLDSYFHPINPGAAYQIREDIWKEFLVDGKFDYTYNERFWYGKNLFNKGNLETVIKELRRNSDTRQAILMIHSPEDTKYIGGKKRIPCSMYYDFLIRPNQNGELQLNITYHQRSADFITHFGNDVWLAWQLMVWVSNQVGVNPGYLYHTIDSLHSYKKDWDKLKTPISNFI